MFAQERREQIIKYLKEKKSRSEGSGKDIPSQRSDTAD